ncbi:hypothetical protein HMPREF3293_02136 [Christensenella minuta]|uniref:Uncharacterized protein n=1 Tax=Christensenella minuta TaxID=626937 RepID=A0A136Q2K3_9FIRM|nr:hypothetical protein HMPREF3293_02136 [Christensenella minuta]
MNYECRRRRNVCAVLFLSAFLQKKNELMSCKTGIRFKNISEMPPCGKE